MRLPTKQGLRQGSCLGLAIILLAFGLLGLVPGPWHIQQKLFGLLALAPIINYLYIGFGLALCISMYLRLKEGSMWPHPRLSQLVGVIYCLLAIGGFLSHQYWLNTFPSTYASAVIYGLIGSFFVYAGYIHQSNVSMSKEKNSQAAVFQTNPNPPVQPL